MKSHLKSALIVLISLSLLGLSAGCKTANGFGQDVEKAGEKIQEKTQ